MIIEDKIIVKNYKCFDDTGNGFDRIMPLNIIIGKNNSGKSSLIDLVRVFISHSAGGFSDKGRDRNNSPIAEITHRLTEEEILRVFKNHLTEKVIPAYHRFEYGREFIGVKYTYQLTMNGAKFFKIDASVHQDAELLISHLSEQIYSPFFQIQLCNIPAERDITPETLGEHALLEPNGSTATTYIQHILTKTRYDSSIVETELLNKLNEIINPDIIFTRILVQENNDHKWELFFENKNHKQIALSNMGSGIKTILLVLLYLIVRPIMENRSRNQYVFAFEELENNLHPSLQRRLYDFIIKYSKENSVYFFITTHSNIVIDIFAANEDAQIIHVTNDGNKSTTTTILSTKEAKHILQDLGIKASDILQSNGVIWVEGPSDRNYLNKWLEILAPNLHEGMHYSIMFYGGRLLANLCFDYDWFNREVIPLLKINHNSFVLLDRDGESETTELNNTKQRINQEIGEEHCWITQGREIENYLSENTIKEWLLKEYNIDILFENEIDLKLEESIEKSFVGKSGSEKMAPYNKNKKTYSAEIAEYIDSDSMDKLNLMEKLNGLIDIIRGWNK